MNPDYCYILDAGVQPEESSLRLFFKAFEYDSNVGGVCGYMGLRTDRLYDDFGDRADGIEEEDLGFFSRVC